MQQNRPGADHNSDHQLLIAKCKFKQKKVGKTTSQFRYDLNKILYDYDHRVQFSHSVVSHSLQPHRLQHSRPPCPSPTPGVYTDSCPQSRCCHSTISSSVGPFSTHPQSFPASGSSQMSQLFASCGQYWSLSFNLSSSNEHPGLISLRMDWLDLFAVQGTLKSLLQTHSSKASILQCSASLQSNSHILTSPLEKPQL